MINLVDIRKTYRVGSTETEVLKGINLHVGKGELLSIRGPSGCGKSTIMNITGLLDRPSSGYYYIDDRLVEYTNDDNLSIMRNRTIGFVFQQYNLLSRLTAIENVGVPLLYRGEDEREIKRRSMEFLKKVDMPEQKAHHKPVELSGGERQRVAIARALAGKPVLILADEPTGALDTKHGQDIMDLFKQLNKDEGIIFIIVTHNLSIAEQCKRFVVMQDGVLVEQ